MALINCRKCGKQISDKASACPACSNPVNGGGVSTQPNRSAPTSNVERQREYFDGLSTAQKKVYITKLRAQLNGKGSAFLNECIRKYNAELQGGRSQVATVSRVVYQPIVNQTYIRSSSGAITSGAIAEPSERFIAYLYDQLLLLPGYIFYFISMGFYGVNIGYSFRSSSALSSQLVFVFLELIYFLIILIVQIGYWKQSTSFGKNKKGLVVVKKDTGTLLTGGTMFLREVFGKLISGMVFSLGFIWILIDKDKQGWHDKLVSSVVVKK